MVIDVTKKPYEKQKESSEEKYKKEILDGLEGIGQKVPTKIYEEKLVVSPEVLPEKEHRNRVLQRITQKIVEHQTADLEPLKTVGRKITGNLFDRVEFLRMRMEELKIAVESRERLHSKLIAEIQTDIVDREKMLERVTNPDHVREHKLDISLLKMERRKEEMLFWRDAVNLRKELQETQEEYQNELKIANLFSELNLPK